MKTNFIHVMVLFSAILMLGMQASALVQATDAQLAAEPQIMPWSPVIGNAQSVDLQTAIDGQSVQELADLQKDAVPQTTLLATMYIDGDSCNCLVGDEFKAIAKVTNIGSNTALNVVGLLQTYPRENFLFSSVGGENWSWDKISPGETVTHVFNIRRIATASNPDNPGKQLANFLVTADNANTTGSGRTKVPLNPFMLGGLAFAMAGVYFVASKGKKN